MRSGRLPAWLGATAAALTIFAVSAGLAAMSLHTASGVTRIDATSYHTEFAAGPWWAAGFLLVVPVSIASAYFSRAAPTFVAAALLPQFYLPIEAEDRAVAAGWGDPMLGLGYLAPILMLILYGVGSAVSAIAATSRRRAAVS